MNRRWVEYGPPNYPFVMNRESQQAKGLVAWWPTISSYGANFVRDLTDKGNNATFVGAPIWQNHLYGPAIEYESGNSLSVPFHSNYGTGDDEFTITAFVRLTTSGVMSGIYGTNAYYFRQHSSNTLQFFASGVANNFDFTNLQLTLNEWYLVAASHSAIHNETTIYKRRLSGSEWYSKTAATSGAMPVQSSATTIGSSSGFSWSGQLGDTRLYHRVLSTIELDHIAIKARWELYQPIQRDSLAFVAAAGLGPVYPGRNHPSRNVLLRL